VCGIVVVTIVFVDPFESKGVGDFDTIVVDKEIAC